jgi:hypothetical protein
MQWHTCTSVSCKSDICWLQTDLGGAVRLRCRCILTGTSCNIQTYLCTNVKTQLTISPSIILRNAQEYGSTTVQLCVSFRVRAIEYSSSQVHVCVKFRRSGSIFPRLQLNVCNFLSFRQTSSNGILKTGSNYFVRSS